MTDNAQRRRIILAAAERLLEHYGMSKTTIADIAREASIGVGTVYLEFGSKNDIIGHVAGAKHRALLAEFERIAALPESPAERLRGLLDARVRAFRALALCGTHAPELVHCGGCGPVQVSWRDFQAAERTLVGRLLDEGSATEEFHVQNTSEAATTVLDAYASFAPPWGHTRTDEEFEKRVAAMHDLVLRGLRVSK